MRNTTIRPGWLVGLSTNVKGNVSYRKEVISEDHITEAGELKGEWNTEKLVALPAEYDEAIKVRSRCRALITAICSRCGDFGLLCPESRKEALDNAVLEAQALADSFNRGAERTRIGFNVIAGHVAQDDAQAVRSITSEVDGLIEKMESGLQRLDVNVVRDAAKAAKNLGQMLSTNANDKLQEAIKIARSAARQIVKAAETGAAEIDQATLAKLRAGRAAFLDLSEAAEVETPEATGRAVDLNPEIEAVVLEHALAELDRVVPARSLEIEEHSPLCDCQTCTAEFGETVALPKAAARQIELL